MTSRGKRIDVGIFRDARGYTVIAQVGSAAAGTQRSKEVRMPLSKTKAELTAKQEEMRVELRKQLPKGFEGGTLGAASQAYLETVPEGPNKSNIARDLKAWCDAGFRDRPLAGLTARDIQAQLTTWLDDDLAGSTVNKRRTALMSLYRVVNGREGVNPVRAVPKMPEPHEEARDPGYDVIERILKHMPDRGVAERFGHPPPVSLSKTRLTVMAYTGWPQMVIEKIEPHDLARLDEGIAYMRPRRKGHGKGRSATGHWVPLIPQGVEALRAFMAAKAFGRFSRHSVAKSFQVALRKAIAEWQASELKAGTKRPWPAPANLRPYDLRHAFGTEAFRVTGDLKTVAELLGHADPQRSTARYARAALSTVMKAGRDKLAAAFAARRAAASGAHAESHAGAHARTSANVRPRLKKSRRLRVVKKRRSA